MPRYHVFASAAAAAIVVVAASSCEIIRRGQSSGYPVEFLWAHRAPGAVGDEPDDRPTLTVFLPTRKPTGTIPAVVVFPGGGYQDVVTDAEGEKPARWLAARGIAAFVVKYRTAPRYHHPAPLLDAQRAIRTVRARAREWNVDTTRIGVWGFSAGGHLAATVGTHFDPGDPRNEDMVERVSSRPAFMILVYPVITMKDPYAHIGSRESLLGANPDPSLIEKLSIENQVIAGTPPTFLMHADGDTHVPPENSVMFYLALRKFSVPAEIHIYEKGEHGFALGWGPILSTWPDRVEAWLGSRGVLRE